MWVLISLVAFVSLIVAALYFIKQHRSKRAPRPRRTNTLPSRELKQATAMPAAELVEQPMLPPNSKRQNFVRPQKVEDITASGKSRVWITSDGRLKTLAEHPATGLPVKTTLKHV